MMVWRQKSSKVAGNIYTGLDGDALLIVNIHVHQQTMLWIAGLRLRAALV
jgi:hypothetical protein